MNALALPANSYLAELEGSHFSRQAYTGDTAHRLGLELAAIICKQFPDLDQDLLSRQIECDYLEWAYQTGNYRFRADSNGRPLRAKG